MTYKYQILKICNCRNSIIIIIIIMDSICIYLFNELFCCVTGQIVYPFLCAYSSLTCIRGTQ